MSVRSSSCSDQDVVERRDEGADGGVQSTESVVANGVPSAETNGVALSNGVLSSNGNPSVDGIPSPISTNGLLSPNGVVPKPPHRFKKKSAPLPPPSYPAALSKPIEESPKVSVEEPQPVVTPVPAVKEPLKVPDEDSSCPPCVNVKPRPSSLPPTAPEPKPRTTRPASTILETFGFRSAGSVSAKSAPATPHSEWTPPVSPTPPRSPSNSAASRHDKHDSHPRGGKPAALSTSAPASGGGSAGGGSGRGESPASGGGGGVSPVPPPGTPTPAEEPGSSKSRQKKFHRHFKQVAQEERVLNYYSCALVADILLQGQLYITKNYFAFYSNVFGYVTKLLIPTASVLRISKEKTARIIPNAVGVATTDEKHVFGSLLSRDATYRLMTQVWKSAMLPEPAPAELRGGAGEEDDSVAMSAVDGYESSLSGSERSCGPLLGPPTSEAALHAVLTKVDGGVRTITTPAGPPLTDGSSRLRPPRPPGTLLAAGTALLVCLFLSAGFLLYRISLMQTRFNDNPLLSGSDHVYQEILKWQAQLHSRSASEVQDFLSSNLDQLAKVRQSLEALSQLLLHNEATARDQRPNS